MPDNEKKAKSVAKPTTFDAWMGEPNALAVQQEDKREQFFKTVMEEIFSDQKLELRTRVNGDQVRAFSVGFVISDYLGKDEIIEGYIDHQLKLLISLNGGSRREMENISKGLAPTEDPESQERRSMSDRLFANRR